MNGLDHIANAFTQARLQNRAALMPYLTLGYPSPESSLQTVVAAANNGADLLELGIPFSDPLADGPTIQHSTQIALEQGINVRICLSMVQQIRQLGIKQPLLLMGYINPILAFGMDDFVAEAQQSGADGLIIPDLPPEEADRLRTACQQHGLALIFLLSPASPPERVRKVAELTTGFLYLVSLTGVTGARSSLRTDLPEFISRAKASAHTPVAVGFGISTPLQAAEVGKMADGVIVGSALLNAISQSSSPSDSVGSFVKALRNALETPKNVS